MGFSREKAIESIDAALDEVLGYDENRTFNSEISEELYNDMLRGFEEEAESKEKPSTNFGDESNACDWDDPISVEEI